MVNLLPEPYITKIHLQQINSKGMTNTAFGYIRQITQATEFVLSYLRACLHNVVKNEDLSWRDRFSPSLRRYRAGDKAITAQPSEPFMLFHPTSGPLLAHLGECFRNDPGFMHRWSTAYQYMVH